MRQIILTASQDIFQMTMVLTVLNEAFGSMLLSIQWFISRFLFTVMHLTAGTIMYQNDA